MIHGSLFSGIGGFDLAAEWAGIETKWQVETDNFCNKILEKHFPNAKRYKDIKETKELERVDIITGGFPCQPFSIAGKRKGKDDDRYLWEEMLRIITEVKPTYVIGENVANLWNMGFENLLVDLEDEGYEVESFIIPACAVNAPHRRDRIWIVAYNFSLGWQEGTIKQTVQSQKQKPERQELDKFNSLDVTYTKSDRWNSTAQQEMGSQKIQRKGRCGFNNSPNDVTNTASQRLERSKWEEQQRFRGRFATQSGRQSESWDKNWYEVATEFCRVDARIPNRVDRLKSLGNAIVPQIAYILFEAIKELNSVN